MAKDLKITYLENWRKSKFNIHPVDRRRSTGARAQSLKNIRCRDKLKHQKCTFNNKQYSF
jgi:hypothetical protein